MARVRCKRAFSRIVKFWEEQRNMAGRQPSNGKLYRWLRLRAA